MTKENRRRRRIPCVSPIRISWEDEHGQPSYVTGKCIDISEDGLRIEVREAIPVHTRVQFRIEALDQSGSASVRHATRRNLKVVIGLALSHSVAQQILESLAARGSGNADIPNDHQ
jgi:hypothetical protein